MKNAKSMFTITKDEIVHVCRLNLFMGDIHARLKTIQHKEAEDDVLNIFASVLKNYVTRQLSSKQSHEQNTIDPDTRTIKIKTFIIQDEIFVTIESKNELGINIAKRELNHFLLNSDIILSEIDSALSQESGVAKSRRMWVNGWASNNQLAQSISGRINELLLTFKLKTDIENIEYVGDTPLIKNKI